MEISGELCAGVRRPENSSISPWCSFVVAAAQVRGCEQRTIGLSIIMATQRVWHLYCFSAQPATWACPQLGHRCWLAAVVLRARSAEVHELTNIPVRYNNCAQVPWDTPGYGCGEWTLRGGIWTVQNFRNNFPWLLITSVVGGRNFVTMVRRMAVFSGGIAMASSSRQNAKLTTST